MELGNILEFRKDLYFEGAVQADWFYTPEKAAKVAENFVFHGKKYFGVEDQGIGNRKRIDTISLVEELAEKMTGDHTNALTLAIADYGTGKSHLAVTLGHILSGKDYMPETYNKIITNIANIDNDAAKHIQSLTDERNFVMVINGMRDFNLHSEILKAAQKSLKLYGLPDDGLKKLNRALETAEIFFDRNAKKSLSLFEEKAKCFGWIESGEQLIDKIYNNLMTDETAFDIVNAVYKEINGQEIRWDEGLSASNILEMIISEYCGMNGQFEHVVLMFDEFGRYLEYASGVAAAKSGDSALQQIFEVAQNMNGVLQVINFIQSDIKVYLQRVDQTKNISRYIGRYDASDKYYISSNLETVFANLIYRKDKIAFEKNIVTWQKDNEIQWQNIFKKLNEWVITKGMWKDYTLFRKVIVEGIYPMHPLSTFMLTQLSDYLQNRSSLTLISQYIENYKFVDVSNRKFLIMPETLMKGDLYTEMLAAEQEGKQPSQQCIRYDNILRKYGDKLSEKSLAVLRSNLILRILRFRTKDYMDAKNALAFCCGFSIEEIEEELKWLENEYAVLGFDDHAGCFDFMEESNGAHDFKVLKKRLMSAATIDKSLLQRGKIQEIAGILEKQTTNFALQHKITTTEWLFDQEMYAIEEFDDIKVNTYLNEWKSATNSTTAKGRLVWLYVNRNTDVIHINRARLLVKELEKTPIIIMLLNDIDNRLYDALLEYDVLDQLDDINRNKYDRYYQADFGQAENNLRDEFSELKKQKIHIGVEGTEELNKRIPIYLTSVFENLYPDVVPFSLDGFITKGNSLSGKGGTYYCTIVKMLLSNSVNEITVHNLVSDVRNRIEALLMTTNATSWKCIDEEFRIIPPEEKNTRRVYDDIVTCINQKREYECKDIFDIYCRPPYGMSEDVVVLMIAVICANLSYCLRFRYNNTMVSVNNWKELVVIKDKKINIDVVRNSALVMVDAGAVTGKYMRFFARVKSNKNITEVVSLEKILANMMAEDEIPEELNTQYLLARKYLDSGKKAIHEWQSYMGEIDEKVETTTEENSLYDALKGLQLIEALPYTKIFKDNGYEIDEESKETVKNLVANLKSEVNRLIGPYVANMYCRSVEGVNTFRNHNTKMQTMLEGLGFAEYALLIKKRKEEELNNVDEIRSRQELRLDCEKFLEESNITRHTTYMNVCAYLKKGKGIQARVEKYGIALGKDFQKINDSIRDRVAALEKNRNRTMQDMSDIWNDLCEVKNDEDIIALLENIDSVLQKGIPSTDQVDFEELKDNLHKLLEDINTIKRTIQSRAQYEEISKSMLEKYEKSELEFDVIPILKDILTSIKEDLDEKEKKWINNELTLGDKSRKAVHHWKEVSRFLPRYLSEDTITKVKELDKEADALISESKIEDVIFYFDKLDNAEKAECIRKLQNRINSL
ncbi:hypothetical protein [Intestinibacter bartlettii]|uniref:hypothetical protein n=1 Tax=Intestinibacter bartlettii TaxID=261299 RepID=UPI00399400D9